MPLIAFKKLEIPFWLLEMGDRRARVGSRGIASYLAVDVNWVQMMVN